jgi:hypothetical protein
MISLKLIYFSNKLKSSDLTEGDRQVIEYSSQKLILVLAITISHELCHYKWFYFRNGSSNAEKEPEDFCSNVGYL